MDNRTMRRVREFALVADATMNALPRPVPPRPTGEWDGETLDVSAFYEAYNRLPEPIQEIVAAGYQRCLDAFDRQTATAFVALSAKYQMFADLMVGTGLTPEQIIPDLRRDSHLTLVTHEEPETESAEIPAVPITPPLDDDPTVTSACARRLAYRGIGWGAAAASLIAVGCFGSLAWQRLASPPAVQTSVDVSVQAGIMTPAPGHVASPIDLSSDDPAAICRPGDVDLDALPEPTALPTESPRPASKAHKRRSKAGPETVEFGKLPGLNMGRK